MRIHLVPGQGTAEVGGVLRSTFRPVAKSQVALLGKLLLDRIIIRLRLPRPGRTRAHGGQDRRVLRLIQFFILHGQSSLPSPRSWRVLLVSGAGDRDFSTAAIYQVPDSESKGLR